MPIYVDIREPAEYDYEHIPGSLLFSMTWFDNNFPLMDKISEIIFYCQTGKRSQAFAKMITGGTSLEGGIEEYAKLHRTEGKKFELQDFSI